MSENLPNAMNDLHRGLNSFFQIFLDQQKEIDDLKKEINELKNGNGESYERLGMSKGEKLLLNGINLDTVKDVGTYYSDAGQSAVQRPNDMTDNSFRLVVKRINTNNIQQELITAISDQNFTRVHQFSSGKWSDWKLH